MPPRPARPLSAQPDVGPRIGPDAAGKAGRSRPTTDRLRVLGVDPGLGITGYGVIQARFRKAALVEAGVLRTKTKAPLADRLASLFADVEALIGEVQPDAMAIEEIYSHVKFPKTSIVMGHARGVLLLAAGRAGVPVTEYPASRVKLAVSGSGRAGKDQVGRAVANALGMDTPPQPADVSDALAIALCHANSVLRPAGT